MRARFMRMGSIVAVLALLASVGVALAPVAEAAPTAPTARLLVMFREGVSGGMQDLALLLAGVTPDRIVHRLPEIRTAVITASAPQNAALESDPLVESVDRDVTVSLLATPDDPDLPSMTGLADINMTDAWEVYPGDGGFAPGGPYTGAPIGLIDSGVESHQEFTPYAAKVPVCVVYPPNILYDPGDCTNSPDDTISHGTHVAGTLAANADDGLGVPGVSPTSPVLSYKGCEARLCWLGDVAAGVVGATNDGAKVINLSLGGPAALPPWLEAIQYALRNDVVVAAAAGNDASSAYSYPASWNGVLSVAALITGTDLTADFSQYNNQVDIAGPGTSIRSSVAPAAAGGATNAYLSYSGTSMATPHVAGVAALVRSAHPDWTAGKVRGAILNTATDVGAPGPDIFTGRGRLDAAGAITYAPAADGDLDDDGLADEWDADPDDPTRFNVASITGSGARNGVRVDAQWLDFLGFFSFGIVQVTAPGRTFITFASGGSYGTGITGATLSGVGLQFGTSGISSPSFRLRIADLPGGDLVRLQIGAETLIDGTTGTGLSVRTS